MECSRELVRVEWKASMKVEMTVVYLAVSMVASMAVTRAFEWGKCWELSMVETTAVLWETRLVAVKANLSDLDSVVEKVETKVAE